MLAAIRVLDLLPFAGGIVVILGIVVAFYVFQFQFQRRFDKLVNDAVVGAGSALKDANVTVHAVKAVQPPTTPSPYDLAEDDENFVEEIDGKVWEHEGYNYYSIDVTIEPVGNEKWDPTALAMVPANYEPEDEGDLSEDLCGLHSAEIYKNGEFVPAPEKEVVGPQRVRLLFAIGEDLKAAKFANVVTYFGHVDLPAPLPKNMPAGSQF